MTKYQMQPVSVTKPLEVFSNPRADIIETVWPSSPQIVGAPLYVGAIIQNIGEYPGDITFIVRKNNASGAILGQQTNFVDVGVQVPFSVSFTMPNEDLALYVSAGYYASVDDYAVSPLIERLIMVATTLTLFLNPAGVQVGGTVNFNGKLTRNDSVPLASAQSIRIVNETLGSTLGTVNTNLSGDYSGTFTAPAVKGSYSIRAYFDGSGLLSASASNYIPLGLAEFGSLIWLGLAAAVLYIFRKDIGIKI